MKKIQIINAKVFNSFLKRFEDKNVLIEEGCFHYIDNEIHTHDELIDANNMYMIPGFIDSHMHIESSMCTPRAFSNAALVHGTTTVLADAHEIANVYGVLGLNEFMKSNTLLDVYYAIPSSVPSTNSSLETTGGFIGVEEVKELCKNEKVIALGEVMNFNDAVNKEDTLTKQIIKAVIESGGFKTIEGHCARTSIKDVSDFLFAKVTSCHTEYTVEGFYNKIISGMFIQLQKKAITKEVIKMLMDNKFYEYFSFVTDDVMPDDLKNGHLNTVMNLAIECGMDPIDVIYCSTFTPARRMHLEDRGAISPGRIADFMFIDDLRNIKPSKVFKDGILISENQKMIIDEPLQKYPSFFYNSIKTPKLCEEDFMYKCEKENPVCNIMEIQPHTTRTNHIKEVVKTKDGYLDYKASNLCLISVFNRYVDYKDCGYGLVKTNFKGAICSSWCHDNHNLMVMGNDPKDMAICANTIIENQGGMCIVENGEVKALVKLPIAGIVSDVSIDELAKDVKQLRDEMKRLGYVQDNEIMSFAVLSLLVSPVLKISNKGLVDVINQKIIDLID